MKEREGFVTKFKVATILDSKMTHAMIGRNKVDKRSGTAIPVEDPYQAPKDHVFRVEELKFNQKDFQRQIRTNLPYNPHNMSEFNTKPQAVYKK